MKCSESWLREWANPSLTRNELCHILTMAGLEVEELVPVAQEFSGVIIGQVMKVDPHPEADHLYYCEVNVGTKDHLKIVCGAKNIKVAMKVPVAMIDAVLPNNTIIKPTTIRNVSSQGMLCSEFELGLSEENQGLFELPEDAPIGMDIRNYLSLDDYVIDISITPNRGDCLSVKGIAREVSALTKAALKQPSIPEIKPTINDTIKVKMEEKAKAGCPHYVGRIIRNVKADSFTPAWLKERLRRSGIRSISPIVDVTNYVMLELGQPMHAFDLNTLSQEINIRLANKDEKISLLDGSDKELDLDTLVIADQETPQAIAGVMGGMNSSVTLLTKDIFLESAYFSPQVIARQRQYYGINSESSYRFERGVDPKIQRDAIERATQLILEITGGNAGPIVEVTNNEYLPKSTSIVLSRDKIKQILGISIPDNEVETILKALGFSLKSGNDWLVQVPSYRFDISVYEDLIEEIARLHGYNQIPTHSIKAELYTQHAADEAKDFSQLRQLLSDQGYHEIISYSFIEKSLQSLLDPQEVPYELMNPITADMSVMRTNLWPGLVNTLLYNKSRQQHRIRLFEIGTCFIPKENQVLQIQRLGGVLTGSVFPEQWGQSPREVDFYDLKGDLENLLSVFFKEKDFQFQPGTHPALHPGQTASIYYHGKPLGVLGGLHPSVLQALDINNKVWVFELDLTLFAEKGSVRFNDISKFPEIRRDIAILVNQAIPAREIQDTIKVIAGNWLKEIFIFDVYQGKEISPGLKSIALALILQHPTRTLVDDEVADLIERVITTLKGKLGAELRS